MVRLFSRVGFIVVIMLISTTAAIFIGRRQSLPPILSMLQLNACDLPCWNNITPGITTLSAIIATIQTSYPAPRYSVEDLSNSSIVGQYILITDHISRAQMHLFVYSEESSPLVGSIYVGIISVGTIGGDFYTGNLIPRSGLPEGVGIHYGRLQGDPTLYYNGLHTIFFLRGAGTPSGLRVTPDTEIAGFNIGNDRYFIERPQYAWQGYGIYSNVP